MGVASKSVIGSGRVQCSDAVSSSKKTSSVIGYTRILAPVSDCVN